MTQFRARILVVDDDPDIRANLADILQDMDYQVDVAADGPSALERAGAAAYDLVLLDLRMPGMNGLEVYRQLKRLRPDTPVIVITAYTSGDVASEILAAGACEIVSKPVEVPRLLEAIEGRIDRPLVLIVDDDRDLCASLADVLADRGYRVAVAHHHRQALAALDDRPFHALILDMKLPQGNGLTVFREARARQPELRVVLITGFRTEMQHLIEFALKESADTVCYKPIDLEELLEHLRKMVP
ncbi:MAG: response regulator [Pirellulales bacterium]|nr:response regulator [Pirellulales bacterium]